MFKKLAGELVVGDIIDWAGAPADVIHADVFEEGGVAKVEVLAIGEDFTASAVIAAGDSVYIWEDN